MSGSFDRMDGHRYAPGHEPAEISVGVLEMSGNLGELSPVIAAVALLLVIIARTSRARRLGPSAKAMRELEAAARQESFRKIGTDLRLRHEAGETGDY